MVEEEWSCQVAAAAVVVVGLSREGYLSQNWRAGERVDQWRYCKGSLGGKINNLGRQEAPCLALVVLVVGRQHLLSLLGN